jgi:HD domain-containing protein
MHRPRPAVLFVHDASDARVENARWLADANFRCYVADDADSACRIASTIAPEVVVIAATVRGSRRFAARFADRSYATAVVVIDNVPRSGWSDQSCGESPAHHLTIAPPGCADDLLHPVRCALAWRAEMAAIEDRARRELAGTVRNRQRMLRDVVRSSATPALAHERLQAVVDSRPPVLLHARRVAMLARAMAQSLNLSPEACADIEGAALLHDLGKLALPETVLSGEAPIGDAEMEALLESHGRTLQLLEDMPAFAAASWLIRESREWWDGSGGPEGTRGWDIPLGARILAVADALETAQDCEGRSPSTAAAVSAAIRGRAGTRFDPDLVGVALRALEGRSCC